MSNTELDQVAEKKWDRRAIQISQRVHRAIQIPQLVCRKMLNQEAFNFMIRFQMKT